MSSIENTRDTAEVFSPPPGPPPPELPHGWAAKFDTRYQRFFYVNLGTKKSQWEKPLGAIDAPASGRASGEGNQPPPYADSIDTSIGNSTSDRRGESTIGDTGPKPLTSSVLPDNQVFNSREISRDNQYPNSIEERIFSPKPDLTSKSKFYQQQQLLRPDRYDPQQPGYYQQQPQPGYIQSNNSRYIEAQERPHGPGVSAGTAAAVGAGAGLLSSLLLEEILENDCDRSRDGLEDGEHFYVGLDSGRGDISADGDE